MRWERLQRRIADALDPIGPGAALPAGGVPVLAFLGPTFDTGGAGSGSRTRRTARASRTRRRARLCGCSGRIPGAYMGPHLGFCCWTSALSGHRARWARCSRRSRRHAARFRGGKALWIGTRPSTSDHPFQKALGGLGVGFSLSYAARPNDPPFQRRTWKRANPGLDHFPDLEAVIRTNRRPATSEAGAMDRSGTLAPAAEGRQINRTNRYGFQSDDASDVVGREADSTEVAPRHSRACRDPCRAFCHA